MFPIKQMTYLLIIILTLTACSNPFVTPNRPTPTSPSSLPDPQVYVTPAPDVDTMLASYFSAWQADDYAAMYLYLSPASQSAFTEEDFIQKYNEFANTLTLQYDTGIEYSITNKVTNPDTATATVQVNYNTNLFGMLTREIQFDMVREKDGWHLNWDTSKIIPDLQNGNTLEIVKDIPTRGNIYANDGYPIATQEDVVAIGFTKGNLDPDLMSLFYSTMADLTVYQISEVIEIVDNANDYDYIPLGEALEADVDRQMGALSAMSGVYLNYYTSRYYSDGGIAPQAVGHLSYISPEEVDNYLRAGYALNARFGGAGIEFAYEDVLAGTRGGSLYLKDTNGQIVTKLAERSAEPAQSVTLSIDSTLQYYLQQSLGNYRGAIVVMEIDTGRILAMVSSPGFDTNFFDAANINHGYTEEIYGADNLYLATDDPVFNRATNGQYPLGSVSKIITMAAALESGVFTETSEMYCGSSVVVCGNELYDWTYEHEKPPSGDLTLPEGLMRSCNPWFYTIGETLFQQGFSSAIADMARAFGLGSLTGIDISEQAGNIPADTNSCEVNAQLAIGQGEMTVTPLQVARFVAAIGNGGTLYRPSLVDSVGVDGGTPTYTFEPEAQGTLPVSDYNMNIITEAMRSVITNARGTANIQLATMPYRAYGKTGTATNPFGESHAWFAGYTSVGNPDRPDIAVAVILENAGEGSEMAAPVFRRAVSLYFSYYTDYGYVLPWEAVPYVVKSPTPIPTDTPY